jgi:hypothetical protein
MGGICWPHDSRNKGDRGIWKWWDVSLGEEDWYGCKSFAMVVVGHDSWGRDEDYIKHGVWFCFKLN